MFVTASAYTQLCVCAISYTLFKRPMVVQIFQTIYKYGDPVFFFNEIDVTLPCHKYQFSFGFITVRNQYIVEGQCHRDFKFIDVHRVYIVKYLKVACGLTCIDLIDCCIIIYFKLQIVGLLRTSPDCENTQCNYWSFSIQADCK